MVSLHRITRLRAYPYFRFFPREIDRKLYLYCNDRYDASVIKTIVEFYSTEQRRMSKLLSTLQLSLNGQVWWKA